MNDNERERKERYLLVKLLVSSSTGSGGDPELPEVTEGPWIFSGDDGRGGGVGGGRRRRVGTEALVDVVVLVMVEVEELLGLTANSMLIVPCSVVLIDTTST